MNETLLTKDAEYLFCVLYREYKDRRANGINKATAKFFGGSEDIYNSFFAEWNVEDIDETCRELDRCGFITCNYADDMAQDLFIEDKGIVYMENRFKNTTKELIDAISKLRSLLFG